MIDNPVVRVTVCLLVSNPRGDQLSQTLRDLDADPVVALLTPGIDRSQIERQTAAVGRDVVVIDGHESLKQFGLNVSDSDSGYTIFLPANDLLGPGALTAIRAEISAHSPHLIYLDEDDIGRQQRLQNPQFKPDPSYEYLLHMDYIGSLLIIKNTVLRDRGGLNLLDYHLDRYRISLQLLADSAPVRHIPKPLYHSRRTGVTPDLTPIIHEHLGRRGEPARVQRLNDNAYEVRRELKANPMVSIVVPFRDQIDLLRTCIEAVIQRTTYSNFEILGISNRSRTSRVFEEMERLSAADDRVRFIEHNIRFNFSALVNYGVSRARGEHIVLMNNDIAVINPDWLEALIEHVQNERIGVAGGKLLFPDGSIQHAGLSVQKSGYVAHLHKHYPGNSAGYMNRLVCAQNVTAVTGALCMFRREVHTRLDGFDESRFAIALNDVDFCLRALHMGYLNVFTPYCKAYHHESVSRGYDDTAEKSDRFAHERALFAKLYRQRLTSSDPYYNPNLDQRRDDFSY